MNTMSLLRNSVIVGGATFLVGSAFMEIGKADSKSDIGKWPYVATFLSGALGFYLLKQNFIPVPKALELNADSDNIIRFKVGERYTHRYHHGYGFYDNEVMRRTDKTVWTSQVNPETGEVDYPLLVSQHRIYTKQPFELDGEIVSGHESYGLGNHAYGVAAGDTSLRTYDVKNAESSSSLQSFAAEVFEADRKIRRRTRWTWTRGQESGFEVENDDISELPYDIDYTGRKGRGYYGSYVPIYSVKDSYHISDLPEGYHLHLYKPALRSSSWKAFSKSPTSDWKVFNNYKKSNLTGELLSWYNEDIAKPEQKTLSPIEKLMISKGMKSGTIQIERIVIPKTKYTTEKIQYFAFGGSKLTKRTTPLNFCVIDSGVVSLENVEYEFEPHLFAFAQGLKFMTEKAGTLRSVNRFNKDPEAWVKSYPAWFQNAVKNKLTDIDVEFIGLDVEKYDSGMQINDIVVLKFLNGVDRYSWRPINEDKRKVIDTPYGEMPQFEIYELDMNDPAPIIPRPSTMQKIYAKSFKQNLIGDWKFDKEMFMMAVVDKYKFENGGSESIHNSMTNEPIWVIETIPYMTPMAELMARRYKKKLN
jgi:hypothetical protein